jgi:hypothetical protein
VPHPDPFERAARTRRTGLRLLWLSAALGTAVLASAWFGFFFGFGRTSLGLGRGSLSIVRSTRDVQQGFSWDHLAAQPPSWGWVYPRHYTFYPVAPATVEMWYLPLGASVVPVLMAGAWLLHRARRLDPALCPKCRYPLRGLTPDPASNLIRCPECGGAVRGDP